jgi:putative endonuclease
LTQRQRLGRRGEALARRHLQSRGYVVLEANYRTRNGEIDLVAEKDGGIVFVEVRTRASGRFGPPEESVTPEKREHLVAAAQQYLQDRDAADRDWRIDLVAVEVGPGGRVARLDILENVVEL